jgi:hypothetical protein
MRYMPNNDVQCFFGARVRAPESHQTEPKMQTSMDTSQVKSDVQGMKF